MHLSDSTIILMAIWCKLRLIKYSLMSIWKRDNSSLQPKTTRLILRLTQYNVHIKYLHDKANIISDALSNVFTLSVESNVVTHLNALPIFHITNIAAVSPSTLQELHERDTN